MMAVDFKIKRLKIKVFLQKFTDILLEELHLNCLQHYVLCRVRRMPCEGIPVRELSELFCKKYINLLT